MTTVLLGIALLTSPVLEPEVTVLPLDEVPGLVPFTVYRPDRLPVGFRLVRAEMDTVPADPRFSGLGERPALRLVYTNPERRLSFELTQAPTTERTDARSHVRWILDRGTFAAGVTSDVTFVTLKRGDVDLGFKGAMFGQETAAEILRRATVWPRPR